MAVEFDELALPQRRIGTLDFLTLDKRDDKGNDVGGGSGYGNVKGYLDTWGTMMADGAYEECLPDLLRKGFVPDAHQYDNDEVLGFFTDVREDNVGLWVAWQFHGDEESQAIRAKYAERIAAGKSCGMSIGFNVGDGVNAPVGWTYDPRQEQPEGIDYICIMPADYATQIPRWSKPQYVAQNLERARDRWCVYVLLRVNVMEVSLTLMPSNEASLVAEVRSANPVDQLLRECTEEFSARLRALLINTRTTMAKTDAARELHDKMTRAFKKASDAHEEARDAMDEGMKHARKLSKELSKMEEGGDTEKDDDAPAEADSKRMTAIDRARKISTGK